MKRFIYITLSLVTLWTASRTEFYIGRCQDQDGNGRIYTNSEYNYISYSGTAAAAGDIVLTIDLLNPLNAYCDDVIIRYDKIILKNLK